MEIHQKIKVVVLIKLYKIDQLTIVIRSIVGPKNAKYFENVSLFEDDHIILW